MLGKRLSALLIAVTLLGLPTAARALTFNVTVGNVDLANLCALPVCTTPQATMAWNGDGPVSGTVEVAGGNVTIDLTVSVLSFAGNDSGVTALAFQNVSYTGTFAIVGTPNNFSASGMASASGTLDSTPGGSSAYNASPLVSIDCDDTVPNGLKCGVVVNGATFSTTVGGNTRYVPHTMDLTTVPEPGASVMGITVGLAGLVYARRRKATN